LGQRVTLAANNSAQAQSRALRNNPNWDSYQHQIRVLSASPQQESTSREFFVGNNRLGGTVRVEAPYEAEALHAATRARPEWSIRDLTATEVGGDSTQSPSNTRISDFRTYTVTNTETGQARRFAATSEEEAINIGRREYPALFSTGNVTAARSS
jgi:hypothetical protein